MKYWFSCYSVNSVNLLVFYSTLRGTVHDSHLLSKRCGNCNSLTKSKNLGISECISSTSETPQPWSLKQRL